MNIVQTYETTITSPESGLSATVLIIPARSLQTGILDSSHNAHIAAEMLFDLQLDRNRYESAAYIDPARLAEMFFASWRGPQTMRPEAVVEFAAYVANARIIPFESSPLGAESLASIAAASVKAGTITLGATVGYVAGGPTPFLLITVPLGIVLCGASVSFAKWMEENRNKIWSRLTR